MKRKNYFLLFMVVLVYFFIFAPLILIEMCIRDRVPLLKKKSHWLLLLPGLLLILLFLVLPILRIVVPTFFGDGGLTLKAVSYTHLPVGSQSQVPDFKPHYERKSEYP